MPSRREFLKVAGVAGAALGLEFFFPRVPEEISQRVTPEKQSELLGIKACKSKDFRDLLEKDPLTTEIGSISVSSLATLLSRLRPDDLLSAVMIFRHTLVSGATPESWYKNGGLRQLNKWNTLLSIEPCSFEDLLVTNPHATEICQARYRSFLDKKAKDPAWEVIPANDKDTDVLNTKGLGVCTFKNRDNQPPFKAKDPLWYANGLLYDVIPVELNLDVSRDAKEFGVDRVSNYWVILQVKTGKALRPDTCPDAFMAFELGIHRDPESGKALPTFMGISAPYGNVLQTFGVYKGEDPGGDNPELPLPVSDAWTYQEMQTVLRMQRGCPIRVWGRPGARDNYQARMLSIFLTREECQAVDRTSRESGSNFFLGE